MDPSLDPLAQLLLTQTSLAAVYAYAYEWLKRNPRFPLIEAHMKRAHRVLSAVYAALVASGLTVQWTPEVGTLLISGLTVETLRAFVLQWFGQQVVYQSAIKKAAPVLQAEQVIVRRNLSATDIADALDAARRRLQDAVEAPSDFDVSRVGR